MNTSAEPEVRSSPETGVDIARNNTHSTQPFFWSLRREIWENRSIYLAPLIVATVALSGFLLRVARLPERRRAALLLDPVRQRTAIEMPYDMAAMMILLTALLVGVFYCLDALYGERRDRSILFWKSLPVSDLTTVLSKATVPMVVLPLLSFAVIVVTQLIMLFVSSAVLLANGINPATTWTNFHFFRQAFILLYGLAAMTLWYAPIYAWLLLVSGWVRRAGSLGAVLPLIAMVLLERIAFNSWHFARILKDRLIGWVPEAFSFNSQGDLTFDSFVQLTPGAYLRSLNLWIGLAFAVGLIAAAIRLRRYRGPL